MRNYRVHYGSETLLFEGVPSFERGHHRCGGGVGADRCRRQPPDRPREACCLGL